MNLLKKNKPAVIIAAIVLLGIGIWSTYEYVFAAPEKTVEIAPEYTGDANEFNYLVTDNPSHWRSKVVQITGTVTDINNDGILLNGTIYCQFENIKELQPITKNQRVIIKGKFVGFDELLIEMKINQCILIQ